MRQGVELECVNCNLIQGKIVSNCKYCKGTGSYFKPAQMMDKESGTTYIWNELQQYLDEELHESNDIGILYTLLEKVLIYNFDVKEYLVERIKKIENNKI